MAFPVTWPAQGPMAATSLHRCKDSFKRQPLPIPDLPFPLFLWRKRAFPVSFSLSLSVSVSFSSSLSLPFPQYNFPLKLYLPGCCLFPTHHRATCDGPPPVVLQYVSHIVYPNTLSLWNFRSHMSFKNEQVLFSFQLSRKKMGAEFQLYTCMGLLEAPCSTTKEERKKGREENNQSDLAL